MMGDLREFLQNSKLKLSDIGDDEIVHVVLGNEACDLDSAVSAIVYAFLLYKTRRDLKTLFVPALNTVKHDYRLKTDIRYALGVHDISQEHLVFRDEIDLRNLQQKNKLKLTLVDFHRFSEAYDYLDAAVVEVLDHHKRERKEREGVPEQIERVGSCSTLVAERLLKQLDESSIPEEVSWLLYRTILVDTACLSQAAGIMTSRDVTAIETLERRLPSPDRNDVYNKLVAAKSDVSSLSTMDLLRKDLKIVTNNNNFAIAMSSVPSIEDLLGRKDLLSSISLFTSQQGAAALVLMAFYHDQQGEPRRQLAVYSANSGILERVKHLLENAKEPSLELGAVLNSPSPQVVVYPQGNWRVSRKVLLPKIRDALDMMDSAGGDESPVTVDTTAGKGTSDVDSNRTSPADFEGETDEMSRGEVGVKGDDTQTATDILSRTESDRSRRSSSSSEASSSSSDSESGSDEERVKTKKDKIYRSSGSDSDSDSSHNEAQSKTQSSPSNNNEKDLKSSEPIDPFHNETNIVLEDTLEHTTAVSPNSDLSGRSNRSESNPETNEDMNLNATSGLLAPGSLGVGGSLGIPSIGIIPVTPINSPTESPSGSTVTSPQKETELPSFNSSEMVEKIREKKASIGGADDISEEADSFPYTPVNSYTDGGAMHHAAPDRSLPSFLNQEMVSRINEKKSALEGLVEEDSDDDDDDENRPPQPPENSSTHTPEQLVNIGTDLSSVDSSQLAQMFHNKKVSLELREKGDSSETDPDEIPFMPQNSHVDSHMDNLAKDLELSGLQGAEIMDKVAQKRASLGASGDKEDDPLFTPPNSYTDTVFSDNGPREGILQKDLVDRMSSLDEENTEVSVDVDDLPAASPDGNVVAYRIAQEMLAQTKTDNDVDKSPEDEVGSSEGYTVMKGESDVEVAERIAESVINSATQLVKSDELNAPGDLGDTVVPSVKENTPSPPAIIIQDMSEEEQPTPDLEYSTSMEGIAVKADPRTESMDSGNDTYIEDLSQTCESPVTNKKPDSNDNMAEDLNAGANFEAVALEENDENGDNDDEVKSHEDEASIPDQGEGELDAQISGGVLLLGEDPGESHTEPSKDEPQSDTVRVDDVEPQITSDGALDLGEAPGESHTDPDPEPETSEVTESPEVTPRISSDGLLDLGTDPGESSTDPDVVSSTKPGDQTPSTTKKLVEAVKDDSDPDAQKTQILTTVEIHRHDLAEEKVVKGLSSAMVITRQQPDGGTAPQQTRQPPEGSTGTEAGTEIKLTKQQRTHLEGVRKALDIDLDLSSEDDEEIKNLKDQIPEELSSPANINNNKVADRPTALDSSTKKKIVPNLDLLNDNAVETPTSPFSDDLNISLDEQKTPDLTTPDILNDSMYGGEVAWGSGSSAPVTPVEPIPEYTAREEFEDARHWKSVQIGERWYKIDMKVIEPYKKVLSHGGYYGDGFNAIVVFTACYLPDRRRRDYHYVMDNLFLYVISTLDLLVVEDYMIVYFHGATPRNKMPSLHWLKRCYDMIDRRLKKNLKALLVVHPTIWLRTLVFMTKPFVSAKFSSKLRYIKNLEELTKAVPTEYIYVPEEVQKTDKYSFGKSTPKRKFINL